VQSGLLPGAAVLSTAEEVPIKEPIGAAVSTRPRVVILGSGWASMSMIKALPETIRCAAAALCTAHCTGQVQVCTAGGSAEQFRLAFTHSTVQAG
jgi:hypothetical protein